LRLANERIGFERQVKLACDLIACALLDDTDPSEASRPASAQWTKPERAFDRVSVLCQKLTQIRVLFASFRAFRVRLQEQKNR
jgi:hypothetical protein